VTNRLGVERLEARDVPAAFQTLPVLPFQDVAALDHTRAVAARGQLLGRQTNVVLKIGDSNSSPFFTPEYLAPLGSAAYNPYSSGIATFYPELLDTWGAYRSGPDSLAHEGPTAWPGWTTATVLGSLAGELRATNPGVALVMIGTNDAMTLGNARQFESSLSSIVTSLLGAGVVPVLSTIPDSHYKNGKYEATLMAFNQVIANVADRYAVPLWNAWRALHDLPNEGLKPDGVHVNVSPNGGGSFWAADLLFAQNVRNLQALQILDWFREVVAGELTDIAPADDWLPMDASRQLYAVGRDLGASPTVDVYDADTGELVNRFLAFGRNNGSGVRVATGDANGDGFTDVVCATGDPAGVVKVISGADGSTLASFQPFGNSSGRNLRLAVGDLDGDGATEVVVGRSGGAGVVRVYRGGTFTLVATFRAYSQYGTRGLSVAVANVEGLGPVVVAAGGQRHGAVGYFDEDGTELAAFRAFDRIGNGFSVAAADLDGDGFDEIAVGRTWGADRLRIFDGATRRLLKDIALGPVLVPAFGLRLGTARSPGGSDTLLVGSAPGSAVSVRAFNDLSGVPQLLPPERANRAFGIFVG
jgi:hypothetical protein